MSSTSLVPAPISASSTLDAIQTVPGLTVGVVGNEEDRLKAYAVRIAVYVEGQDCPWDEEFDGNDYACTHILAHVDGEPVGTIRLRFFGSFAKLERLAIRESFRGLGYGDPLIRFALELCAKKGFRTVILHAQNGREPMWSRHGFEPSRGKPLFDFSGYGYTEMTRTQKVPCDAIGLDTPPMVTNRPEGQWDRVGVLEGST